MSDNEAADIFAEMLEMQSEAARQVIAASIPDESAIAVSSGMVAAITACAASLCKRSISAKMSGASFSAMQAT